MNPLRALCLAVVAAAALPGSPARAAAPSLKQIALPPSALPDRWVVGGAIGVPGEMSNSPSKGVRWFSRIYTPANGTGRGGLAFVVEQIYFAPDHAAEISSGLGRELRSRKAQRIAAAEISALWVTTYLLPPEMRATHYRTLPLGDEGHELVFAGTSTCCRYGATNVYVHAGSYLVLLTFAALGPVDEALALELTRAAVARLPQS